MRFVDKIHSILKQEKYDKGVQEILGNHLILTVIVLTPIYQDAKGSGQYNELSVSFEEEPVTWGGREQAEAI